LKEIRPLEDIDVKPNVSTMHFPQTIKANGFSLLRGQGLPQIIIFANHLF
jgi:hypothetical protein